jgi:peptide/nickel transport system permease protein
MSPLASAARTALRRLPTRSELGLVIIALLGIAAVAAPILAQHDPLDQHGALLEAPSRGYWLGTDDLGRDVFSRLVHGARVSLLAGLLAVSVGLILGMPLGLWAGFQGGWIDIAIMRVVDTLLAFPALILAIAITAALGASLVNSMLAVGILFAPAVARLMRAQVLSVREEPYVEVARSCGATPWRLVTRHVVPNAVQPVLVQASTMFGLALLSEAGLSFLGLGVQPPDPSWGAMLARSYSFINRAPLQITVPGLAIVISVFAFNAVGDLLQDVLDPRHRRSPSEPSAAIAHVRSADAPIGKAGSLPTF